MSKEAKTIVRLNIYLPERSMRRRVKSAAARQDLSVSEYCVGAIASQLAKDGEADSEEKAPSAELGQAVRRARRFQARVFGKKVFSVSSADLVEKARTQRDLRDGSRRR